MRNSETKVIRVAEDLGRGAAESRRSARVRGVAGALARKLAGKLELVYAEELSGPLSDPVFRVTHVEEYVRRQRKKLEALARRTPGKATARFEEGPVVASLLRLCRSGSGAELMTLGTHGRTGVGRLLLGSVAEEVIRRAEIPVMTLGPRAQHAAAAFSRGRRPTLLLATDLGSSSLRAERYAASVAHRLKARLVVAHCLYEGLHPVLQTAFSVSSRSRELDQLVNSTTEAARGRLERTCERLRRAGVDVEARFDARNVEASTALLDAIKTHEADLVVMGTHGRGRVLGAFLGSTARKVILESPAPVITVRGGR